MNNLDLQESLLIYSVLFTMGFIVMIFLSVKYYKKINGLFCFNLYFLFNTLGVLGVYFRNQLPLFISVVFSNYVLLLGIILLFCGLLRFLNKKIPYLFITIHSVTFILLFVYFTYYDPFYAVRIVIYVTSTMLYYGMLLCVLIKNNRIEHRKISLFTFLVILIIILSVYRLIGLFIVKIQTSVFDFNFDAINASLIGTIGSFFIAGILALINSKLMKDIQEGESAFNKLIKNLPTPAFVHNKEGVILNVSNAFTANAGYTKDDVPDIDSWINQAYNDHEASSIKDAIKSLYINRQVIKKNDVVIQTLDKKKRNWVFHSGHIGLNSKGEEMAISIALDNTDNNKLKDDLIISESRLKLAQSIAQIGTWELDLSTKTILASKVAFEIYELKSKDEYVDLSTIQAMRDKEDSELVSQALIDLIESNKPYNITFRIHTKSKKMKYIHSRAELINNSNGIPIKVLGVLQDVTSIKEKEFQLEHSAYNDFLTGVNNRRYYEEHLEILDKKENFPITIVMADINGLKLINDAFGHASGDNLLISAARLLKTESRKGDIVARIGGDEFVIVMPKTSEEEAEGIIDKINEKAREEFVQSIELSISFGYKTKYKESENIQDIYRSAEDLMYREKLLEIPSMRSGAIEAILTTLYEKDKGSEVHSRSVSLYSERLAALYGMDRQSVQEVKTAGVLHDIGKIITPISIIQKEGKLTPEEYEVIKNHSEIGFRILNSTSDMRNISYIILNHHERWDGTGYPRRVRGEDIPLKSRIIAIADAFDAMTSERSYRKTISVEEAVLELVNNSGTQFDPTLVDLFKKHYLDIIKE